VLVAACRPFEHAFECAFDGQDRQGALTCWPLGVLRHLGPRFTCNLIHDRVVANVHSQFERQMPRSVVEDHLGRKATRAEITPAWRAAHLLERVARPVSTDRLVVINDPTPPIDGP
jgi:hypothetical protein